MPLSRKYCRSKKRKSKSHKYICKKYKLLKRSKKTCRRRSRKDYGNIFRRKKEIPEKFEDASSIILFVKPSKRIKLSNAQYKRIQDWTREQLRKKKSRK